MTTIDSKTPAQASNVYLFKNGYGMIVKTFEFPPTEGKESKPIELIDPPADPVHGTFWIQSLSNNTSINSIRSKKVNKLVDKECVTIGDLVQANVGEDVLLLVTGNTATNAEWTSGKIKSVKRGQQSSDDEEANSVNSNLGASVSVGALPGMQPEDLVLFETSDKSVLALRLSSVQSIRSPTLKTTYQRKVFKNCLSIDYKNDSGSIDIGLMKYLTFGITWVPSYNLTILSSNDSSIKRLRLLSKAVILNDIENMNIDHLFCIVGFPNISKFASIVDPMISGDNVKSFLDQLGQCEATVARTRHYNHSAMSNSIMTQQMVMPMSAPSNSGPDDTQQDANVDDLHLYEFKNILLQKKERLTLPIFDIEIPYKDVYHCKIDASQSGGVFSGYDEKKGYEEVWHSVEFENISDFVWTTAPIVITKGQQEQQFIGQDTLTYTIKGSTSLVKLTKALNVRVQLDEKVVNVNPVQVVLYQVAYQTDDIEGTISVMNYKSEEVVVVINTSLMGKTGNYSITPKKDAIKAGEIVVNQQHDIQWEVNVKPKQTMEIKYTRSYKKRAY